jgi:hypothetical protein
MGFGGGCKEEKSDRGQCDGAGGQGGGWQSAKMFSFVIGVLLHTLELNIKTTSV